MKHVMIVDDDLAILQTVGMVLRRKGYQVTTASGGFACLEELRKGFRGVVLMDIMMPDLDGWATIREIVAGHHLPNVLVCMLTAKASPGTEGSGLEEVVFDYLPKPFDNQELLRLVENAAELLPE
jgi:DNA-binding response OmpR family regulator